VTFGQRAALLTSSASVGCRPCWGGAAWSAMREWLVCATCPPHACHLCLLRRVPACALCLRYIPGRVVGRVVAPLELHQQSTTGPTKQHRPTWRSMRGYGFGPPPPPLLPAARMTPGRSAATTCSSAAGRVWRSRRSCLVCSALRTRRTAKASARPSWRRRRLSLSAAGPTARLRRRRCAWRRHPPTLLQSHEGSRSTKVQQPPL
jgi:hypothetical protein